MTHLSLGFATLAIILFTIGMALLTASKWVFIIAFMLPFSILLLLRGDKK